MEEYLEIGPGRDLSLLDFWGVVDGNVKVKISEAAIGRLGKTTKFIDHLLEKGEKVYGLTTGFADLRRICIPSSKGSELSRNLIHSHDAGIGKSKPHQIVIGAMLLRANSLALGHSGFTLKNLMTLVSMINHRITPKIPSFGSLGASGDLADLARLGTAMEGQSFVEVFIDGKIDPNNRTADVALKNFGIKPAAFGPKEGLALTNGTSFLCASACYGYIRLVGVMETFLSVLSLFMNAVHCVEDAFTLPIQSVRNHTGQSSMAKIIHGLISGSPFLDKEDVQNDYCIRCLPQIFGYQYEQILGCHDGLVSEMNAVTDNPLIFCGSEVSDDVPSHRIKMFEGEKWTVLSGGNFHGEYIAQICDTLTRCNVKPVLAIERQMTYMLNRFRHKREELPVYLIHSEGGSKEKSEAGLRSGFMITQYCGNALAHKISFLGQPMTVYNITSANESEDVVSYGASSALKLVEQVELLENLCVVYTCECMQAYGISRAHFIGKNPDTEISGLLCEKVFKFISSHLKEVKFPISVDRSFGPIYDELRGCLFRKNDLTLREMIQFPLCGSHKIVTSRKEEEEEEEGENQGM